MICELCGKEYKRVTRSHLERKHGISAVEYFKSYDEKRSAQVISLYATGLSGYEVGERLSISGTTVKRILRRKEKLRTRSTSQQVAWSRHSEQRKKEIVVALQNPEARQRGMESQREYWKSPAGIESRQRRSERMKKRWAQFDYRLASGRSKQNKAEALLERLIKEAGLPFRYVGDGATLVGSLTPDFISTDGSRKIVELFGEYWHDPAYGLGDAIGFRRTEAGRKQYYKENGFRVLIIWYKQLMKSPSDSVSAIQKFAEN